MKGDKKNGGGSGEYKGTTSKSALTQLRKYCSGERAFVTHVTNTVREDFEIFYELEVLLGASRVQYRDSEY